MRQCLYLATFDPTVSTTGTTTRGRLFLDFFADRYGVHLVHLKSRDEDGKADRVLAKLRSVSAVEGGAWSYFVFSRALYARAAEILRQERIDFIFADFEKAGWYASLLSRRFGTPYVYSSHNVEYRRYLDLAGESPLRYPFVPYMYLVERQACRDAALTLAISEPDAAVFRSWVPEGCLRVMPCAFDEAVIYPQLDEAPRTRPVVLLVGNYRNTHNRAGAYLTRNEILPQVVERHPDAVFRFVGKTFPDDIRHPNLEAAGFVDDLTAEYAKATVVIAPVTMGGGIKIKVIEALAAGTFLIATPKAMEGIDPTGLENLRVAAVADFPRLICEAIETRPPRTTRNWAKVTAAYGTRRQFAELADRIDGILNRRR